MRLSRTPLDAVFPRAQKYFILWMFGSPPVITAKAMSKITDNGSEACGPVKSQNEVLASLKSLTHGQKTALMKIARLYAKATLYDHQDLMQEAFKRVLSGERKWPTDLPTVPFFRGVIRSVAYRWSKEKRKRKDDLPIENEELGDEGAQARGVIAKLDVERVLSLFDDDPKAKCIVVEMMNGAKGEGIMDLCGLSQTEYENKRKKIRRRIEKLL